MSVTPQIIALLSDNELKFHIVGAGALSKLSMKGKLRYQNFCPEHC